MVAQAGRIGIALSGQSPNLAPADGRLYALRNQTGLIDSIPLIVSSILSKKIAGGCDTVVLDVKCGSGAFMTDATCATALRDALVSTGERCGLKVFAEVTDMSQPLGSAVGNAIEIREARNVLVGEIDSPNTGRFRDFVVAMAQHALAAVGFDPSLAEARLADGSAADKARGWFTAQGGDFDAEFGVDPATEVLAERDGWISGIDAHAVGAIALELGAGRKSKTDTVRGSVGLEIPFPVGMRVSAGDVIGRVHSADISARVWAVSQLRSAIAISDGPVTPVSLVLV
jgi:thymidine phosphorylase